MLQMDLTPLLEDPAGLSVTEARKRLALLRAVKDMLAGQERALISVLKQKQVRVTWVCEKCQQAQQSDQMGLLSAARCECGYWTDIRDCEVTEL